jgi:cytochrome oxidase Cu insertion factor (SCO1/SenC/PrrC family)
MRARVLTAGVAVLLVVGSLAAHADAPIDRHLVTALRLTPLAVTPPPLALQRMEDGRTVTLGELRGRPVLLYFWATW